MKKNGIQLLDKTGLSKYNKSIIGVKYNKITTGSHKGLFEAIPIVSEEGVLMSTWTKEQEAYLDKRFLPLESDMKEVKSRLSKLESGMKEVKSDVKELRKDIFSIFKLNGFKVE